MFIKVQALVSSEERKNNEKFKDNWTKLIENFKQIYSQFMIVDLTNEQTKICATLVPKISERFFVKELKSP